jgi:hypothetical protein
LLQHPRALAPNAREGFLKCPTALAPAPESACSHASALSPTRAAAVEPAISARGPGRFEDRGGLWGCARCAEERAPRAVRAFLACALGQGRAQEQAQSTGGGRNNRPSGRNNRPSGRGGCGRGGGDPAREVATRGPSVRSARIQRRAACRSHRAAEFSPAPPRRVQAVLSRFGPARQGHRSATGGGTDRQWPRKWVAPEGRTDRGTDGGAEAGRLEGGGERRDGLGRAGTRPGRGGAMKADIPMMPVRLLFMQRTGVRMFARMSPMWWVPAARRATGWSAPPAARHRHRLPPADVVFTG